MVSVMLQIPIKQNIKIMSHLLEIKNLDVKFDTDEGRIIAIDNVSLTNLTQLQPVNGRTSNAWARWSLSSTDSNKNLLDFASYGKNKYDYIHKKIL